MTQAQYCLTFAGEATGGTFVLYDYADGRARCASVETMPGESAEKVINRLADVIEETNPFDWVIIGSRENTRIVTAAAGELRGLIGGTFFTAGTEIGLNIPKPPHSLTCNPNWEANSISLKWTNPPLQIYDSIHILWSMDGSSGPLPGNAESYVLDLSSRRGTYEMYQKLGMLKEIPSNETALYDIHVFGIRGDISSNVTRIRLIGNTQWELFGVPFTNGVAPNWQAWSLDVNGGRIIADEGKRPLHKTAGSALPDTPFYQVINTSTKGGTGGVFRKFIGLTPGHTYRVKTRVATLSEPNLGAPGWSVSVHAAPNGPDGRDLTAGQMAGLDALPGGSKGPAMGRMALYDSSLTTKGRFVEVSTDVAKPVRGREITDVTLPEGVDSITVWVTCNSSAALSAGLDWIAIEDLSVQNP